MSATHSPEPWSIGQSSCAMPCIRAGDGEAVCGVEDYETGASAADARRIVACVNACAGITTEALEALLPGTLSECWMAGDF